MSRLRTVIVFCLLGFGLSGCVTAAATLAMSAVSLATGGGGGGKQSPFKNPVDKHSTGRQVRDALSRLDDKVDPACQQLLDQYRESEPMSASAASSALANAPDIAPPATAAKGAKESDGASAASAGGSETTDGALPGLGKDGARAQESVQMASASQTKFQGDGIGGGPGICQHRLVCLPGTPKPTMMLMCPGRNSPGTGADEAEKTVISSNQPDATPAEISAEKPAKDDKTPVSSDKPAAAPVALTAGEAAKDDKTPVSSDKPAAAPVALTVDEPAKDDKTPISSNKPAAAPVALTVDEPAKDDKTPISSDKPAAAPVALTVDEPAKADKTVISSNKPDAKPVETPAEKPAKGGVADWDWSQDPSHRL